MRWRRFVCWLRRHAPLLHVADGRLWLRCLECGYETPGVWIMAAPPRATSARVVRFKHRIRI